MTASSNMNYVSTLKLKCSLFQAKDFETFIVQTEERVRQFLNDWPLDDFRPKQYRASGPAFR